MARLKVYGADWCEDTALTRGQLDRLHIPYDYINVDHDPAAQAWVKSRNNGKQKTPTVDLEGTILIEPDEGEMEQALRQAKLL